MVSMIASTVSPAGSIHGSPAALRSAASRPVASTRVPAEHRVRDASDRVRLFRRAEGANGPDVAYTDPSGALRNVRP
jgi:hypothetical protein